LIRQKVGPPTSQIERLVLEGLLALARDAMRDVAQATGSSAPAQTTIVTPNNVPIDHAAGRCANIIAAIRAADRDINSLSAWALEIGSSVSTIKVWCAAVGVKPKTCLNFARALRIVHKHAGKVCDARRMLAITAPATRKVFLIRAALPINGTVPDLRTFLSRQTFIADVGLICAVEMMCRTNKDTDE
jgi:hypothetical protein